MRRNELGCAGVALGAGGHCNCADALRARIAELEAELAEVTACIKAALGPTAENAKAIALETETRPEANEGYYLEPWEVDIFIRAIRRRAGLDDGGEG